MKPLLLVVALLLLPSTARAHDPPPGFLADLTAWIPPPSAQDLAPVPPPRTGWHVEDGRLLHVLVITGIVLQGMDAYLTVKSRQTDLSEGNVHLAGPLKDRPRAVIGIKTSASILTSLLLWKAHHDHATATTAVAGGIVAGYGWVVAHNVDQFRKAGWPIF
jgi:hypothetical protein